MSGLSLRAVYAMSREEAHDFLATIRWEEAWACPPCPKCGCPGKYWLKSRCKFKCTNEHQFSVTSGTRAANRKLPFVDMIAMTYVFAAGAKGMSSIQLAKTMGVNQRTAFRFAHLLRDAIECEINAITLDGIVEIDGATFGGHRRHTNMRPDGHKGRFTKKFLANRRVVVVAKRRGGRTVPFVGMKEMDAISDIARVVEEGAIIQADGARAWNGLAKLFDMMRVDHSYAFSANQACTNNAESFFSRMRKSHSGLHHQMTPKYLRKYACELAWRLDFKDLTVDERTIALLKLLLADVPAQDANAIVCDADVEAA